MLRDLYCFFLFFWKHIYLFRITNSFWATKLVSCVWIMKNEWMIHGSVINNHVSEGSLEQHGILNLENLPVLAIKVWIAEHSLIFVVLSFEFTWIIISNNFFLFWNKSGSKSVCNWRKRVILTCTGYRLVQGLNLSSACTCMRHRKNCSHLHLGWAKSLWT